jgi:lipid-A-disaccharide synthase
VAQGEQSHDAFAAMDLALACSGTVTTELAMQSVPVIVAYRLDWLTWLAARIGMMTTRYATLLNVVSDREIVPEFIQTRCTVSNLTRACLKRIYDEKLRSEQVKSQDRALVELGRGQGDASDRAAAAVLEILADQPRW